MNQQSISTNTVSPLRLRIGVVLIILWWIPFWLLAPYIASIGNPQDKANAVAIISAIIIIIQTIIGFLGFIVAGSQVKSIIKGNTLKKSLSQIFYMLIHGKLKNTSTNNEK